MHKSDLWKKRELCSKVVRIIELFYIRMNKSEQPKFRSHYPADEIYRDDGKPAHDNPHHAGIHSHLRRAECTGTEEKTDVPIKARQQCDYYKAMKRS
jgi:hypothetical protein